MKVHKETIGEVNVARLSGSLDSAATAAVHEQLMPVLTDSRPALLDFSDVTCVSDGGVRTMLVIYRQAQAMDGKVAVVGLSSELYGALAATGYLKFFHVADSVDSGLRVLHDANTVRTGAARSVVS